MKQDLGRADEKRRPPTVAVDITNESPTKVLGDMSIKDIEANIDRLSSAKH